MSFEDTKISKFEDLIGPIPMGLLRRSFSALGVFILLIFSVIGLVQVPDKLESTITITSLNPPVLVRPEIDGIIRELFVGDKKPVTKKQVLAYLDLEIEVEEIKKVEASLPAIQNYQQAPTLAMEACRPTEHLEGELETILLSIQQNIEKYASLKQDPYYAQRRKILAEQLAYRKNLEKLLNQELESKKSALKLEQTKFKVDQSLYDSNLISKVQFLEAQRPALNTEFEVRNQQTEIEQNRLDIEEIKNNMTALEIEYLREIKSLEDKIDEEVLNLYSLVHSLEHQYQIEAPTEGLLEYFEALDAGQMVSGQDPVFIITPFNNETVGKISIAEYNTADLEVGQTVRIKLEKYPFEDWGIINGQVASITNVPIGGEYKIKVSFPDGFITSYGKKLNYTNQLEGQAEIILEKKTFFRRIFNHFYKMTQ